MKIVMDELLNSLNPEQREAVTHDGGPLLIVAGPGTGKTHTLTARIAWLVQERRVEPGLVLAVTFSNRAANEMRERQEKLLSGRAARELSVGTFHAICWQILLRELGPEWSICSEESQLAIVRQVLARVGGRASGRGATADAERVAQVISWLKARLLDVVGPELPNEAVEAGLTPAVGRAYQQALTGNSLLDFDDLILRTVRLFEESPETLDRYRRWFRHIALDEFQDTNTAQFRFAELLATANDGGCVPVAGACERSLTVIGDPDQAIYAFRGASSESFRQFECTFPQAHVVRLCQCYRSSPAILSAAGALIGRNLSEGRVPLHSLAPPGPKVQVRRAESEEHEAKSLVHEIRWLMGGLDRQDFDTRAVSGLEPDEHYSFADFAVLYRLHAVGAALAAECTQSGIPFQQIGGPLLREQAETRRLLAMLRMLANPIDPVNRAKAKSDDLVIPIAATIVSLQTECCGEAEARTVLERIGNAFGPDTDDDSRTAWERLHAHSVARESLWEFLRRLDSERYEDLHDPRADKVTLMTLHAAKGLEFDVVFLVGCETGVLPYVRKDPSPPAPLPADGERGAEIEEERRLFFVGMTRARRRLVLSWTKSRWLFGTRTSNQPSPFLDEIPAMLKDDVAETTPHATRRVRARGPRQRKLFLS